MDLSNNLLTWLPEHFPTLTYLIQLDLGKNQLTELPEYFGQLKNLRHLDLYSNQLSKLPVSFSQLKNLKWLDLKNNPLDPNLAKAAGPCITPADCSTCAKRVVSLMQSIQSHQERERQKQLLEERQKAEIQRQAEEAERERIRAEKKATKERRRQEAREREEVTRKKAELEAMYAMKHEMERNSTGQQHAHHNHYEQTESSGSSCFWSILMFFMATALLCLGFGGSLIWIYTGGHMDQRSIERALPIIQKDMDATFVQMNKKANEWLVHTKPYTIKATETAHWMWEDFKKRNDVLAHKVNTHLGPYFCAAKNSIIRGWQWTQVEAANVWTNAKPYFNKLVELLKKYANIAGKWMEHNVPIYMDFIYKKCMDFFSYVQNSVNELLMK